MRVALSKLLRNCSRLRRVDVTQSLTARALSALPLPCIEQGYGSGGDQSKYRSSWFYVFGLGAGLAWLEHAHCDAQGDHAALTDARIKVMRAWSSVVQELDRLEASLPFQLVLPRARSPDVELKDRQISIHVPVRNKASFTDLLVDLVVQLGSQSRSKAVQDGQLMVEVAECCAAQVIHLHRANGSGLSVHVHLPKHDLQAAEVEFLNDVNVPLTDEDIRIITSAMRTATRILHESSGGGHAQFWSGSFSTDGTVEDLFSHHLGAFLNEGLDGRLGSAFGELERLFRRQAADREGWEGEPHNRPDPESPEEAQTADASTSGTLLDYGSPEANAVVQSLEKLGAVVYPPGHKDAVDWGLLAGYEEQKEQIDETLLLALLHPEVYNEVSSRTRKHGGNNRPRAVLFEGPPGCGKTTSARVLASQASTPLVYVPIEAIASKWYGESERILGDIFKAAEKLEGCLVFLDEIDSLATTRSSEMHEATRRILGVLLRQLDGFEGKRSIVIGATNRKQDLDPALLSRFDTFIYFQLPSSSCRQQILKIYAQQLSQGDLEQLAEACEGMSGRDLRDICEQAERKTASKIIRNKLPKGSLPSLEEYQAAVAARQQAKAADSQQPLLMPSLPRPSLPRRTVHL